MSKSYWGLRNSAKKAISLAVSLSTALTMSGIAYFAIPAQVASAASCTAYTFSTNLHLGSRGTDVQNLQTSLNCLQNAGLPGTTYFGALTKAAVAAYQKAKGITPAGGYFGPKTRAAVNADLAGGAAPTTGATSSNAALIALIQQLLPAGAQRDAIIAALQATSVATTATTTATAATATTTAGLGPQLAAPATGLAVSLAAVTPPAGTSIVAGGGQMSVLTLALTAGTDGPYTVTGITFTKTGVVSDSSINNLYLFRHYSSQFVAQYQSLSSGRATFAGMNLTIAAGQTYYLDLKVDLPASGLSAGNTVAFALNSASDINSVNAGGTLITETGNFPIQGNSMTVTTVSNPSIANAQGTGYLGVGGSVYAGTTGFLAGAVNLNINSNSVKLSRMVWTETGSITAATDLKNLKLYVNGAQVGATVAGLNSDGTVLFDLSASPATLPTGANTVQVYADVMGGPNRNFTMQILHNYDVTLTDSVYNTTITFATPSGTATQVSVQPATAIVSVDANTPTGNVAKGATGVVLAKFDVKASGENMKVLFVPFTITFAGVAPTSGNLTGYIKNVQLVDDQGNQVGTTISNPPSTTGSTFSGGTATGAPGVSGSIYSDSFGSPTANINYVIPANVTRVWTLKADIQTTATSTTTGLTAALLTGNGAVQGLVSNQTSVIGAASGSALTIATTPFTVGLNTSFGSPTYVANQSVARIASFTLGASSAEGVNVSTLTFTTVASASVLTTLQNLRVYVNGTLWPGSITYASVGNTSGTAVPYSFSGSSPIVIPAGQTVTIDVYADLLSGAASLTGAISLTNATANGAQTNVAETFPGSVTGQNVTITGAGTLAVAAGTTLPTAQVVQGSTGNVVGSWLFSAGPNENIKVTSLTIWDQVSSTSTVPQTFQNLSLYSGGTLSGITLSGGSLLTGGQVLGTGAVSSSITYYPVTFSFPTASPLVVPANGAVTLYLTADVPAYSQATSLSVGTSHTFLIATSSGANGLVAAQGASSNNSIVASNASPASNSAITVVPVRLAISSFAKYPNATYGSAGSVNIPLASLTLSASGSLTSNFAVLKQLIVVLSGAGIPASATATTTEKLYLYDSNNNQLTNTSWTAGGTVATSTPTITLNLATSTPANGTVYVGTPRTYYIYGDTVNFTAPSSGNTNPTISLQITGGTNLTSATFVTQPNYTDSYNLDNLLPNAPFPKSVSITYQ